MLKVTEELQEIIRKTLPHLQPADVQRITDYLISDEVGVVTINDISDVTLSLLQNVLPPIKALQLHRAFTTSKLLLKNKKQTFPYNFFSFTGNQISEPAVTEIISESSNTPDTRNIAGPSRTSSIISAERQNLIL